jgi:hypothetical protein
MVFVYLVISSQMPYTVLVPAMVSKLGFKTKAFPPRQRIPVVSLGCSWCHRGKILVEWDIN